MKPISRAVIAPVLAGMSMVLAAACGAATPGNPASPASPGTPETGGQPAATATATATPAGTSAPATPPPAASTPNCRGVPTTASAYAGSYLPGTIAPLVAIQFVSAQQGWVVGAHTILATSDGGQAWARQYSGPAVLDELDFTGAEHGWAVGQDTVLATSDGGSTWSPLPDPCGGIRSVHFVSPDLGYAVFGGSPVTLDAGLPAVGDGGTLLKTTDGGRTWAPVPGAPAQVQSVCFANPADGFLAALGKVWRTTDGAVTWSASLTEPGPATIADVGAASATAIECAGPSAAWAYEVGFGAAMNHKPYIGYGTQDGTTWHMLFAELYTQYSLSARVHEGPGSYPGPFSAISPDSAMFVGWTPPIGYGLASLDIVTDGSTNSQPVDVGGVTCPFGAAFTSLARGWVVGQDQTEPGKLGSYVIEATTDGGRTWTRQYATN